ncbi:MAG: bifunctional glutamate N-acetyltransferase/amino-acid acetyltransferase ArgJ [Gammaproteobacteria bacterium]
MAVGNPIFPYMPLIAGIKLGTACAGIKQTERDDLVLVEMAAGTACAAVFTQNAFCAAPVVVAREHLQQAPRWLLINSGNANAGTGIEGMRNAYACCGAVAQLRNGRDEQVLPFSTGVIGEPLAVDKIRAALPHAVAALDGGNWERAARAIMTTDTFAKGATETITIARKTVTIGGIAKGAGMIHPNMATLLAFVGCDAKIARPLLQQCLQQAAERSFNRITVDGDTSTNDACVLMASGCSEAPEIRAGTSEYELFAAAVEKVCKSLAEAIVRDGEGATKFMRIVVAEARDSAEAVQVGKTVAHSPLVKTAFFAADPNWGRILAAVGRAGVQDMELDKVGIYLGDVCIVRNGARAADYTEAAGQRAMREADITVTVRLGRGTAREEILTCDFSYDYVRINAEYRT